MEIDECYRGRETIYYIPPVRIITTSTRPVGSVKLAAQLPSPRKLIVCVTRIVAASTHARQGLL